jgi:threonine/homoserine/homoserine lactone efflux protein
MAWEDFVDTTLLLGLIGFCAAAAFTPGPNNLIALASGAGHGFRRTLPHVIGVAGGFGLMIAILGLGLGQLFLALPGAYLVLKIAAALYIAFLAWKLASSRELGPDVEPAPPMTLWGSAAFQWVNPKAWFAALTVLSAYTDPRAPVASMVLAGAINVVMAAAAVSTWALFGTVVRRWLSSRRRLVAFNVTMAVLLVASIVPALLHT